MALLKNIRLKRKAEIGAAITEMPDGTDVVTISRSDRQSNIIHEVWHSKRYINLNDPSRL